MLLTHCLFTKVLASVFAIGSEHMLTQSQRRNQNDGKASACKPQQSKGSNGESGLQRFSFHFYLYMFLKLLNHYGDSIKVSVGQFHRCIVLLALCSYLKTKRKIICHHQDRDLCWYIDCKVYIVNWQLHSRVRPLCICPHFVPRRQICLKEGQEAIYVHCKQRWWFMTSVISHLQCSVEILSQALHPCSHLVSPELVRGVGQCLRGFIVKRPAMVMTICYTPFFHILNYMKYLVTY